VSVQEYLLRQADIRTALEEGLAADQENWNTSQEHACGDIWSWVKIDVVFLPRRDEAQSDLLAGLQVADPTFDVDQTSTGCDKPGTRTYFAIDMRCAWDRDHIVRAEFRDGQLLSIDHG
jgi:hypothetical protein